jgi:hypothetical protein
VTQKAIDWSHDPIEKTHGIEGTAIPEITINVTGRGEDGRGCGRRDQASQSPVRKLTKSDFGICEQIPAKLRDLFDHSDCGDDFAFKKARVPSFSVLP